MSIRRPITESTRRGSQSAAQRSLNANDSVWRAFGIVELLGIGAIHFLQIVPFGPHGCSASPSWC
jgi:hypothetical protein